MHHLNVRKHVAVFVAIAALAGCGTKSAPSPSQPIAVTRASSVAVLLRDPSSVTVLIERASKPPFQRVLARVDAVKLASALARLPLVKPGYYNCPMDSGRSADVLAFATPHGRVIATDDVQGCEWVTFQPRLTRSLGVADWYGTFNQFVLKTVGLPSNYAPL